MKTRFVLIPLFLLCACALSSCAMSGRTQLANQAAAAKMSMLGLPREEVLACMGIPKKKATEGTTEVWSYLSTDGLATSSGDVFSSSGYSHSNGSHSRRFCTVNIVMTNGFVDSVNYVGPTSSTALTRDDQCGYAVANCVGK